MSRDSKILILTTLIGLLFVFIPECSVLGVERDDKTRNTRKLVLSDEARRIHESALVVDGHNDLPWQLRRKGSIGFTKLDIAKPQPLLQTDIPRLRQGGVGAQFWSVYVPASKDYDGTAFIATLEQIEMVHAMIDRYPETFALARTVDEIERIHAGGRIASLIGVEGGHCIENSLSVLRQLYRLGARYMTLTHSDTLNWADSATDQPRNDGLSPFGEDVVREMNRLGMLVDLSHVSSETMKDSLRVSEAPIIFSHSSAQGIADHPRNVPDDILRLVKHNGGIVMVNFYSGYIVPEAAQREVQRLEMQNELKKTLDQVEIRAALRKWDTAHPVERGTVHHVIDHVDYITKVAGIDHVGLGSDFDGVGVLPEQIDDVSYFPFITQALLDRGYSESDIKKILGGNLCRVMREAELVSVRLTRSR